MSDKIEKLLHSFMCRRMPVYALLVVLILPVAVFLFQILNQKFCTDFEISQKAICKQNLDVVVLLFNMLLPLAFLIGTKVTDTKKEQKLLLTHGCLLIVAFFCYFAPFIYIFQVDHGTALTPDYLKQFGFLEDPFFQLVCLIWEGLFGVVIYFILDHGYISKKSLKS